MYLHLLAAFITFAICALLSACYKPLGRPIKYTMDQEITGTWELRQTSAAMNPNASNYPPGNGHLLQFAGGVYTLQTNGQVLKAGPYAIVKDPTVGSSVCLVLPTGEYANRVIYDNNDSGRKQFFQISGKTLTFLAGCYAYDAGSMTIYERIGD